MTRAAKHHGPAIASCTGMREESKAPASESAPRSNARRRLLQGGLSTAPVLMTVVSRPVLGQTVCLAPSAAMSMPTSGTRTQQVCTGLTPDQWAAIPDQWPSPYVAGTSSSSIIKSFTDVTATSTDLQSTTTTKSTITQRRQPSGTSSSTTTTTISSNPTSTPSQDGTLYHCPVTGFGGRVFGQRTMMDVLGMTAGGTDVYSLGRYMVAGLLNACSGRTPVLGEDGVRDMWNDLVNRGYYEPSAGIRWDANDIVSYLRTTMG